MHPLTEYPRPAMRRDSYENLNGLWQYAITASAQRPAGWDGEILVPYAPECRTSGVGRTLQPGQWLHYHRYFAPPAGTGGRVLLLCYPRILGFVFNPISVYHCYEAGGGLAAVIYEVRNTFGEMHSYVAPVRPGELSEAGLRQERDKLFYVSPFLDMPLRSLSGFTGGAFSEQSVKGLADMCNGTKGGFRTFIAGLGRKKR